MKVGKQQFYSQNSVLKTSELTQLGLSSRQMKKLLDVGLTNIDMNGIKVRIYDREKMKEIVFVTTNKGKIAYANELLSNITVIPYEYDLVEPVKMILELLQKLKLDRLMRKQKNLV